MIIDEEQRFGVTHKEKELLVKYIMQYSSTTQLFLSPIRQTFFSIPFCVQIRFFPWR